MNQILSIIFSTAFAHSVLRVSTSLIYGGMAALMADISGISNIGLEGMMLSAALAGVVFASITGSPFFGVLGAILVAMLLALLLSYFVQNLDTHFVLTGLSINMLAKGLTVLALFAITGNKGATTGMLTYPIPQVHVPILKDIPILGEIFSGQNLLTYLAFVMVFILSVFLKRSKMGLYIRSAGEAPNALQSVGISVKKIRHIALLSSGFFAGLAGAFLSMGAMDGFVAGMTSGRGFIALAVASMGQLKPWGVVLAALVFGVAEAMANYFQILRIPTQFVQMIPYVVTLLAITIYTIQQEQRKKKRNLAA